MIERSPIPLAHPLKLHHQNLRWMEYRLICYFNRGRTKCFYVTQAPISVVLRLVYCNFIPSPSKARYSNLTHNPVLIPHHSPPTVRSFPAGTVEISMSIRRRIDVDFSVNAFSTPSKNRWNIDVESTSKYSYVFSKLLVYYYSIQYWMLMRAIVKTISPKWSWRYTNFIPESEGRRKWYYGLKITEWK